MVAKPILITLVYLVLFFLLVGFMKILSLTQNSWPDGWIWFFLLAPVPSYRTWERGTPPDGSNLLRTFGIFFGELLLLLGFYSLPSDFLVANLHWFLQGYIAIAPFLLLIDTLGRFCRFEYRLVGVGIPHIHDNFWSAGKLSEFWSRWNVWFADFLEETCFRPVIRKPLIGMILAFGGSGIFHEYLVNLPLYWVYRINLFGTMMLYFLIQAFGFWFERRYLSDRPRINRLWTWSIVVLPAPLVLNLGTLKIFHLGFFG